MLTIKLLFKRGIFLDLKLKLLKIDNNLTANNIIKNVIKILADNNIMCFSMINVIVFAHK